jgi:HB1, ASXL, restriction endonuclease HTH domain
MDEAVIKNTILDTIEASLSAQLKAVRRLKAGEQKAPPRSSRKGMSQADMAYDILKRAGAPLHVSEIIERIEQTHGQRVDRESLASALIKKVQRRNRFIRSGKNVFGLIEFGR